MIALRFSAFLLFVIVLCCRCNNAVAQDHAQTPEAYSLFKTPLYRLAFAPEERAKLDSNLAVAQAEHEKAPNDPERSIWFGRRLAYLWRYREAIAVYSKGIKQHPNYAKLYRHRGHRYITVREFEKAITDLEQAAKLIQGQPDESEPDGAPNQYNIPTSTLHSNVWYHLGLAYYLQGDFQRALRCYLECMKFSKINDDMLCATSDWLYMTYRRLGHVAEAEKILESIHENMKILGGVWIYRGGSGIEENAKMIK